MQYLTAAQKRYSAAKKKLFEKLYPELNPAQREAVLTVKGPLLVIAGAGSGKTTVLTKRIAHILRYGDGCEYVPEDDEISEGEIGTLEAAAEADETVLPREFLEQMLLSYAHNPPPEWNVLAITFTNKAANEMKTRLGKLLRPGEEEPVIDVWAGTFHSICLRILRKFAEEAGLKPGFTVYDTDDCKKLITLCFHDLNLSDKVISPKSVISGISRAKEELLSPAELEKQAGQDFLLSKTAQIYRLYQQKLSENNSVDFDDIIMKTVLLLRSCREAADYCAARFRYVSVDEYQDTNSAQFELVRLLSAGSGNVMAVGDDDQSIYKFRGAKIENILSFDKNYSDCRVIKLEENYRSTQNILDAANALISHNVGRREKTLFTGRGRGELIVNKKLDDQSEEGRFIVSRIEEMCTSEGRKFSDFAVLYRVNAQSNSLENVFAKSGIPYRVLGGLRFYERKEVKDILAYLCLINNPDDDLRLRRIINEPKRKIGDSTVTAVAEIAAEEHLSMFAVMERAGEYIALSKSAQKLTEFTSMIRGLRSVAESEKLPVLIENTIDMTGYRAMLLAAGAAEADRLENVQELVSAAVDYLERAQTALAAYEEGTDLLDRFDGGTDGEEAEDGGFEPELPAVEGLAALSGFLEEVSLVADIDNYDSAADAVTMMTIHSAKGLEFPVVFLPGVEEGLFPGMQSAVNPEDLEEERRLMYVAITRAKDRLFISHVRERLIYGHTTYNPPSRFIGEIPTECLRAEMPRRPAVSPEASNGGAPGGTSGGFTPRRKSPPKFSEEFTKTPEIAAHSAKSVSYEHFEEGDEVMHRTFGHGVVLTAKAMGGDTLYEIVFDDAGTKKLMATFAKLTRYEKN